MDMSVAAKLVGFEPPPMEDRHAIVDPSPTDLEAGRRLHRSASRATLPNDASLRSRQPSAVSFPEQSEAGAGAVDGDDEEYSWGPSHPCFPHPNPHVPITSPLYRSTRIIRIKRDWMVAGDLAPAFANLYPEVLDPLVTEVQFRAIVKKINTQLQAAFDPYSARAWIDAIVSVATLWLWEDLGMTGVKKTLRDLERWIDDWNRTEGAKEGVEIIPLRRTGYLTLDFQIPDPHIGFDQSITSMPSRPATAGMSVRGTPSLPQIMT